MAQSLEVRVPFLDKVRKFSFLPKKKWRFSGIRWGRHADWSTVQESPEAGGRTQLWEVRTARSLQFGCKNRGSDFRSFRHFQVLYDLSDDPAKKDHPYLPDEILWRQVNSLNLCDHSERPRNLQKEQFSDGVGYSWIDKLMEYCAEQISDKEVDFKKWEVSKKKRWF